ncbi:RNA-binding protein 33 isoform X3 [Rhinatrema bivittatum]|uniref:RNA-binding protein 33 isoform X3 n=1 Tax=Rhinatrema bivittatum TaxID=194408 RepID=UPI0011276DFA|nr:RNA-binding protein 33 isoform X3 [Rhinatrema bivittatum]
MAATVGDDDFDQFDKPGAERSRRRRAGDDDWDSELEDDLLEEDLLSGKKNQSDLSDEELNDDLLQSDEEEQVQPQNFSSKDVAVSLDATTGLVTSFDLSESANDQSVEPDYEQDEDENVVYEEESELYTEEYTEEQYEDAELTEDQIEYVDEQDEEIDNDEVLDLEINEPLDEFPDEDYTQQAYSKQEIHQEQEDYVVDEELEDAADSQETSYKSEEMMTETVEVQEEIKEESDEEDDEDEESCRLRFKTERKEGTIIRLSDGTRERRNIPETLELSAEAKAALLEFEERERQRKQGRYGPRRGGGGGRRGGLMSHIMGDLRRDNTGRGRMQDHRPLITSQTVQPIRSLFQQQHMQPLLPLPHSHHSVSQEMSSQPQVENPRMMMNSPSMNNQQPKNIHINPHFKGAVVTPVQVPLLPLPTQPRPAIGPQRFPGPPDFQQHNPGPMSSNFNQVQRLPHQDQWRNPPPPPDREPFFIGEPRFPNHHMFDQRSPPPPPLLNSNHPLPNQTPLPFNQAGPGFNQPGQQPPNFNQPGQQPPNFSQPGQQPPNFSQPGQQPPNFSQPGQQPPNFNQPGQQPPNFSQPGQQPPNFSQPGQQPPSFSQPGQQPPSFSQPGQQPPNFSQPGQQPPSFSQPGQQPPSFNQPGQQPGFPRERPIRPNIQPHGPVGILHFNQPGSATARPFMPPRQQFPQGPGQPFMPLVQPNMQGPLHPPLQPQHQHHHLTGPPQPLLPIAQPQFRPHLHAPQSQPGSTRMQLPQRQGLLKPRHSTPIQNVVKRPNQQLQSSLPRNSNLRELPIAPSHMMEMGKNSQGSTPAAQVKPITSVVPPRNTMGAKNPQIRPQMKVRAVNPTSHVKVEVKTEPELPDEDEETRLYRLKIEEQKRLREEILKQKELRRQQQAGARKKELLERLAQQQQSSLPLPPAQGQQEEQTPHIPANGSPLLPQPGTPVRQNMKNRLLVQKQETLYTNVPQRNPHFQPTAGLTAGLTAQVQEQQKTFVKQLRPNRIPPQSQMQTFQKMQTRSAVATNVQTPPQTARVASIQGRLQELRPGAKRTVMQRASSAGGDGPHVGAKVRVIKLPAGQGGENVSYSYPEGQPQRFQQLQQQRQMPVRKVTLSKGTVQQQQQQLQQAHIQSTGQGVNDNQGFRQPKAIMRGRGRGVAGQMGRGRLMPNKQNLRVVECKPQPCIVSVEGLSSSTTDIQLKNLLMSVGPIQRVYMDSQREIAVKKLESKTWGDYPEIAESKKPNVVVRISC